MTTLLHPTQHIFGKGLSKHSPKSHTMVEDPAFKDEQHLAFLCLGSFQPNHTVSALEALKLVGKT